MPGSVLQKWYRTTYFKVLVHILVWTAFIVIPHLLRENLEDTSKLPEALQARFRYFRPSLTVSVIYNLLNIAFFYLNAYLFMPKLLNKKKTGAYVITTAISFIAFVYLVYFARVNLTGAEFRVRFPINTFFHLLLFLAMSILYRFLLDRNRNENIRREKETENLKTELAFLRSQVSPHFMFNVLNNIVALSRTQPKLVEPALIQLSQLLRYMLYESNEHQVTLIKELEYLDNYIQLQKMRFGDDVSIDIKKEGNFSGHLIEPMLLIPFVENAFKHGVCLVGEPHIVINISSADGKLHFEVCNKYKKDSDVGKEKHSGIGLQNVMRRLKLLYPSKHELRYFDKGEYYCVTLILQLNDAMYSR